MGSLALGVTRCGGERPRAARTASPAQFRRGILPQSARLKDIHSPGIPTFTPRRPLCGRLQLESLAGEQEREAAPSRSCGPRGVRGWAVPLARGPHPQVDRQAVVQPHPPPNAEKAVDDSAQRPLGHRVQGGRDATSRRAVRARQRGGRRVAVEPEIAPRHFDWQGWIGRRSRLAMGRRLRATAAPRPPGVCPGQAGREGDGPTPPLPAAGGVNSRGADTGGVDGGGRRGRRLLVPPRGAAWWGRVAALTVAADHCERVCPHSPRGHLQLCERRDAALKQKHRRRRARLAGGRHVRAPGWGMRANGSHRPECGCDGRRLDVFVRGHVDTCRAGVAQTDGRPNHGQQRAVGAGGHVDHQMDETDHTRRAGCGGGVPGEEGDGGNGPRPGGRCVPAAWTCTCATAREPGSDRSSQCCLSNPHRSSQGATSPYGACGAPAAGGADGSPVVGEPAEGDAGRELLPWPQPQGRGRGSPPRAPDAKRSAGRSGRSRPPPTAQWATPTKPEWYTPPAPPTNAAPPAARPPEEPLPATPAASVPAVAAPATTLVAGAAPAAPPPASPAEPPGHGAPPPAVPLALPAAPLSPGDSAPATVEAKGGGSGAGAKMVQSPDKPPAAGRSTSSVLADQSS
eukprot:scaffold9298_cov93-Isochrysis_galbana.AAC.2